MSTGDWWLGARCRGRDSELWFADIRSREAMAALMVCGSCPVTAECLAAALRAEAGEPDISRWGIWAATSPRQRAALANGSIHGTPRAPAGCRCGPCRDRNAAANVSHRMATMRPPRPRKTA